MLNAETNIVVVGNVCWSKQNISEYQDGRPIASVECEDIHHAVIRYGFVAQHPIIQLIFGSVMLAVSLFFLIVIMTTNAGPWLTIHGASSGAFVILGGWLDFEAIRRGYFLEIHKHHGRKKISFGKGVTPEQLASFTTDVRSKFAANIERA